MNQQFCGQCGQQVQEGERFCTGCGTSIHSSRPQPSERVHQSPSDRPAPSYVVAGTKSVGVTVILALVPGFLGFYGIGYLYLDRVARGLVILFADWIISLIGIGFLFLGFLVHPFLALAVVFFLGSLALFIWQIIDAGNLAKEWNQRVTQTGRRPW